MGDPIESDVKSLLCTSKWIMIEFGRMVYSESVFGFEPCTQINNVYIRGNIFHESFALRPSSHGLSSYFHSIRKISLNIWGSQSELDRHDHQESIETSFYIMRESMPCLEEVQLCIAYEHFTLRPRSVFSMLPD